MDNAHTVSTSMAFAQSQISGKVTSSEDGAPVIGASVKVAGTKTGTVTDVDGNFSLNVPAGAKLEVTYLGMLPQTVKAGQKMKIVLVCKTKPLFSKQATTKSFYLQIQKALMRS